jgi:hypothetical protein
LILVKLILKELILIGSELKVNWFMFGHSCVKVIFVS